MRKLPLLTLAMSILVIAANAQRFSVLYNFGTSAGDPFQPFYSGIITQGRDGDLYSSALGGANNSGAIFKTTPAGTLSVLYSFTRGNDGCFPTGGLTLGTDGNFYGATYAGGDCGYGTVFKITPDGSLTTLYNFTNGSDGAYPTAPPIQGTDGNFYGTTCGTDCNGGQSYGTVYQITPSGNLTSLHQFDITTEYDAVAPLTQGTDGNFYGVTLAGGNIGYGVVFKITTTGKFTVLYNFDNAHGSGPFGPLVQGSDGSFYGTTAGGGTNNSGVVFQLTPSGKITVLHNMNGTTDGVSPFAGLLQATDGNFYGTTTAGGNSINCAGGPCGTIFRITPQGSYSVLYNFDNTTGNAPYVTPFQHTNGVVYGDTASGGTGNMGICNVGQCGVFYRWNASLPAFVSLLPYSGKVGDTIEFLGQGFTGTTAVSFNGTAATFTFVSDTYLTATIPSGATTGSVTVTTPSGKLTSNKIFRVTPQITSFKPTSGIVGTAVQITGVSLTQTTKVTFGGVAAATVVINSDTRVTAKVPAGAKTGRIVITTAGGTATSAANFLVTPQITSFTPTSGKVGTVVTITGISLIQTTKVTCGGVAATKFTVNSDTQVTATVPTGAKTGKIALTTPGGVAVSATDFTVTPQSSDLSKAGGGKQRNPLDAVCRNPEWSEGYGSARIELVGAIGFEPMTSTV